MSITLTSTLTKNLTKPLTKHLNDQIRYNVFCDVHLLHKDFLLSLNEELEHCKTINEMINQCKKYPNQPYIPYIISKLRRCAQCLIN